MVQPGTDEESEDRVQVERLTVEEGFLAGLDVQFLPGLNVLIGERGTGKTSVMPPKLMPTTPQVSQPAWSRRAAASVA